MTHSVEHMRQKAAAMQEALNHKQHANVLHPRDGKDHEDHKMSQMLDDEANARGTL